MNTNFSGVITWSSNGHETGKISIQVIINDKISKLTLDYTCNDKPYNYVIRLVTIPSNLGKGVVWYFICPFTGRRCRKLHLIDCKFIHRSALPSGMYSTQTQSKRWRQMEKVYGSHFDIETHYEELYSKHFKKFYNGKPTKRYLKLMKKINEGKSVPIESIERLMIFGV